MKKSSTPLGMHQALSHLLVGGGVGGVGTEKVTVADARAGKTAYCLELDWGKEQCAKTNVLPLGGCPQTWLTVLPLPESTLVFVVMPVC